MAWLVTLLLGAMPISAAAAEVPSYSIWPSDGLSDAASVASDTSPVELGLAFTTKAAGSVTSLRYHRSAQNQGPHDGRLWSADGDVLASVTFNDSTADGWQTAKLSRPVPITPGEVYTASYTAPHGRYSYQQESLGAGKTKVTGDLTALRGVYDYAMGMPKRTYRASNYFVDVVFQPAASSSAPVVTTPPLSPGDVASGEFATAADTGVSDASLRVINGDYHATTKGAVVENLDIRGALFVDASDVTVRNVKVTCSDSWWIAKINAPRVTVQDSTFTVDRSDPSNYCQYGIATNDASKIYRNEISFTPDGLIFNGDSAEVVGNWVHHQIAYPGKADHVDAAQLNGGAPGPFVFRNNHFSVPESQTSCLALFADFGAIHNVWADGNLFDGGGYAVYGGTASADHVRFTNNWFGKSFSSKGGYYGSVTAFNSRGVGNEWTNNRWLDTGALVSAG